MNDNSNKEKQDNDVIHLKCLRWNRPIKHPESQKIGNGKTWFNKNKHENNHKKLF